MLRVLTSQASRMLDNHMINTVGISGVVLMENAAQAVINAVPNTTDAILVLCGAGNNGGDGLSIFRKLIQSKRNAELLLLCEPEKLTGDSLINFKIIKNAKLPYKVALNTTHILEVFNLRKYGVIIDAIFGTGLTRNITGVFADAINLANEQDALRVAVDIPSGVHADTGHVLGIALNAHKTVTFQHLKPGHLLLPGREHTGELIVSPIGLTAPDYEHKTEEFILEPSDIPILLPRRKLTAHKGDNGRALLIAGSMDMPGAAVLSATSALRSGVGLLKVFCPESVGTAISARIPEAMLCTFRGEWGAGAADNRLQELISWADCIAIGPGMGISEAVGICLKYVLMSKKPVVIDADALNVLSYDSSLFMLLHDNAVLTPHPGEAARLMKADISDITALPAFYAAKLSRESGANVLLKGATSVIFDTLGRTTYNITGNPGLAKGGSGDILTGLIMALMCQGVGVCYAASLGAYLLGSKADTAIKALENRLLLASDIIDAFNIND